MHAKFLYLLSLTITFSNFNTLIYVTKCHKTLINSFNTPIDCCTSNCHEKQ